MYNTHSINENNSNGSSVGPFASMMMYKSEGTELKGHVRYIVLEKKDPQNGSASLALFQVALVDSSSVTYSELLCAHMAWLIHRTAYAASGGVFFFSRV